MALAVSGCGGSTHHGTHTALAATGTPVPSTVTHTTPPAPVAPPRPPALPLSPGAPRLDRALGSALATAGPDSGVLVYDLTSQKVVFAVRDGVKRPPASVEKLYTSVALLQLLGPGTHLFTTVLGAGHLGPRGIWHGDLYLRGGGDPTFGDGTFNRVWEHGYGPTAAQLVGQLLGHGIHHVTGHVIGDDSLLDTRPGGPALGYAADLPDYGGELGALTYDHGSGYKKSAGAFAAMEFARVLRAAGVSVRARARTHPTPPGARLLASVTSPSLGELIKLMDFPSDDLFADAFAEQLGVRFGTAGTISAGAAVIHRAIASYDVHPSIVDGSGLSRADGSSPAEVVGLLRSVWHTPVGNELSASLPVVGVSGTVQTIAVHTPAQGNCVAKTGTLNDVTNLAGYCHRRGRHAVAFAVFIDGPQNWQAVTMESKMVAAIARYS